jgi:hypothetical protein
MIKIIRFSTEQLITTIQLKKPLYFKGNQFFQTLNSPLKIQANFKNCTIITADSHKNK